MRHDWDKIKNYYIHHNASLRDLAQKFKVGMASLSEHSREEKWVELRAKKHDEIRTKTEQKTTEQVVDRKVRANELHNELYEKGLEVANILLESYLNDLKKGVKKTKATAYNLDFVMKAIANAQKGQRLSLNITDNDAVDVEPDVVVIRGVDEEKI